MRRVIFAVILLFAPVQAIAEVFRIASFNAALSRKGPGQLLRDIDRQHVHHSRHPGTNYAGVESHVSDVQLMLI